MLKVSLMRSMLTLAIASAALLVIQSSEAALPRPDLKFVIEFTKLNLEKRGTPKFQKLSQKFEPDLFWWVNPEGKARPNGN